MVWQISSIISDNYNILLKRNLAYNVPILVASKRTNNLLNYPEFIPEIQDNKIDKEIALPFCHK